MSELSPASFGASGQGAHDLPFPLWNAQGDGLRHRMMLERLFDGREARWSDALIARTRRHVGGCVSAVEMALKLELERIAVAGLDLAGALSPDHCWRAVQHKPAILSVTLLRHMRDRAALSLMGQDPLTMPAAIEEIEQQHDFTGDIATQLSALAYVQTAWRDSGPDYVAMRTDLPAEAMQDLVWTVAALIAEALMRSDLMPAVELMPLMDRAGAAVLARHDEGSTPFAQASLLALQMRAMDLSEDQLVALARGKHILALIAIMSDRNSIEFKHMASLVSEASEQMLFNMCRAAGFPREVAVRFVLGRRSIARGVEDAVLVEYADQYEDMPLEEARASIAGFRLDEIFRDRLSLLRGLDGGNVR
ncbi:MAG: DUF2336 domain-containing protein [Sphingobium sp.]|nr:DUF2336 domain-containing protein [Sphingobium sp.]MCP5397760.1 DUF2336 domain-containing protein [Sphingomonas sp.]